MAPSPEPQGTEPKAPDKSNNQNNDNTRKDFNSSVEVSDYNTSDDIEMKSLCSSTDDKQEAAASDVSDLNDGELKALLDEAYNYKSPKDREGKSEIFKKFLQEAETAEIEGGPEKGLLFAEAPGARSAGSGSSKRRSGRREAGRAVSEGQSRCGSLQNLSQCHVVDTWQLLHHTPNCSSSLSSGSRRSRHGPSQFRRGASTSSTCSSATSESVSTRQREGGSLPCSVNAVHHTVSDCCVGDDDLQDLTTWHSTYSLRGNSMPKLPSSSPGSTVAADDSPPPLPQEVVSQQSDGLGKTERSSTGPPGFYKQPREEVTTELIAHVEAVKPEKQSEAAETKDHEMYSSTPSYCSSYKVQLGAPNSAGTVPTPSAPAQVDETAEISYLSSSKFHQGNAEGPIVMHPGSSIPPLQLKECDAVCSVMGATPARQQTDNTVATAQNKNTITRDVPNFARGKPIVCNTGSNSISSTPRVYCTPNDDTGPMWERSGNKSIIPSTKLDENGNAVRENSDSATVRKKKQKDKNKPLVMSQNVEGFCGDRDLNDLLSYIEGGTETSQQQHAKQVKQKRSKDTPQSQPEQLVSGRRSQRHSEESSESGKRSKGKERVGRTKIQRANSLEEVSRTKLEDLTAPPESCRSVGDGRNSQTSNWGDLDDEIEESDNMMDAQNGNTTTVTNNGLKQHYHMGDDSSGFKVSTNEDFYAILEASPQHTEDREEFHVVTKKQRRKKQRNRQDDHSNRHSSGYHKRGDYDEDDDSSLHSFGCRSYRSHQTDRRKCKSTSSMPPSDQSGGESSDLDSVHSLPISSTTNKSNLDKSGGSAPQASYADITRMASINPTPELPTNKTSPPKSTQQNHNKNQKVNQAESWEEWPQVCNNKSVSVSSQTAQDMPKKDAMTSTCVDPNAVPLQVSAASVPSVSSVSSSISPASSTISSSNATEPNTPPDTNIMQDFPPLIPSLAESLDKRRVAEDTDKRKSDEPVHENNLPPLPPKNKVSASNINNKKQTINLVDQVKPSELNSTDVNKPSVVTSSSAVMVNGGEHFEQKIVKLSDYKTRTLTKPPAFVCIPHQAPQQQPPPSLAPPQAALTTVAPPSAAQQPQETHQQPAVILLNETQRSDSNSDISGLTFGFEINELLLSQGEAIELSEDRGEPAAPSPQPISDLPSPAPSVVPTPTAPVSHQKTKDFAAMFRSTGVPDARAYNHDEIVDFIGQAWEKVKQEMNSGGKVKYYSKE